MASMGEKRLVFDEESRKKIITWKTSVWMTAVCNTEMILKETRRQDVDPVGIAWDTDHSKL